MSQEEVVVEAPPAEQPEAGAEAAAEPELPELPKLPPGMRIKKPVRGCGRGGAVKLAQAVLCCSQ